MKTIHIFRTHDLEVGTAKPGTRRQQRPGYRWVCGYAEALPNGATSQACRLHEFQAIARESGAKLKRYATEEQARAGLAAVRLEYLRGEIEAERISYDEIHELQSLAPYIEPGDVQLLEWAGVPETV